MIVILSAPAELWQGRRWWRAKNLYIGRFALSYVEILRAQMLFSEPNVIVRAQNDNTRLIPN